SSAQILYRPGRSNDAVLRLSHERTTGLYRNVKKLELLQRYTYNLFSRKGQVRNIATLTEEYSFIKSENESMSLSDVQYLMLSGRYSPVDRYTLYGSARYEKANSPASMTTMYYTAGMTADFRLLSTSIDYTLAKRDLDNRVEKKIAASVRRTF